MKSETQIRNYLQQKQTSSLSKIDEMQVKWTHIITEKPQSVELRDSIEQYLFNEETARQTIVFLLTKEDCFPLIACDLKCAHEFNVGKDIERQKVNASFKIDRFVFGVHLFAQKKIDDCKFSDDPINQGSIFVESIESERISTTKLFSCSVDSEIIFPISNVRKHLKKIFYSTLRNFKAAK